MAYIINGECIACGLCAEECPVEAISEQGEKYAINSEICTDCGVCADTCPTDSPVPA